MISRIINRELRIIVEPLIFSSHPINAHVRQMSGSNETCILNPWPISTQV